MVAQLFMFNRSDCFDSSASSVADLAFSFQTRIRAWPAACGQRQLTYSVGEAERGCGSIYGDGRLLSGPG